MQKRSKVERPLLLEFYKREPDRNTIYEYDVFPFRISIIKRSNVFYYQPCLKRSALEAIDLVPKVIIEMERSEKILEFADVRFDEVFNHFASLFADIYLKFGRRSKVEHELAALGAMEFMRISRLYPFIFDANVQEVYLDSPSSALYIDHARVGRCETDVYLTEVELSALTTHAQTFSGYPLDYSNPSLKTELKVGNAHIRLSIDVHPLSVSGLSFDLRKLSGTTKSLTELILLGTLNESAAAFLITALRFGRNVTILGEPNTGKTTLLNALDFFLPKSIRRVYVEDAVETPDLLKYGYHQAKFKVDPYEFQGSGRSKSVEIIKILHRSPNLLVLGEIQSEEHSKALFHALSSGIGGMQTFHARSPEQALRRWVTRHGIEAESLADLDIFVTMRRASPASSERWVYCISEVRTRNGGADLGDISIVDVFVRNERNELVQKVRLEDLRVASSGTFSKEEFAKMHRLVYTFLKELVSRRIVELDALHEEIEQFYADLGEMLLVEELA